MSLWMWAEAYEYDERVQARTSVAHGVTRLDLRRKPSSVRTCTSGAKIVLTVSKVIPQKESFPARNELSGKKLNKPDASRAVLALAQIRDLRSHAEPEGAGCDPAFLRSSLPANVRTKAISCPIVMPPVGAHCPRTFRVLKSSQVEVPTPQSQSFNCGDWCCHMNGQGASYSRCHVLQYTCRGSLVPSGILYSHL